MGVVHIAGMLPAYDFKLALTPVIEPTRGPRAELATLQDAARFIDQMKPWRKARPHWDFAAELLLKIGLKERGVCPSSDHPCQHPRQVHRIGNAGIHAYPAKGAQMWAASLHKNIRRSRRRSASIASPVLLAENLEREDGANAEDLPNAANRGQ